MKPTKTSRTPVTEDQVHKALRVIVKNQEAPALNYAVNYAKAGLYNPVGTGPMTGEYLYSQILYVIGNISHWRGPEAKEVRETLKAYLAQNKGKY